VADSVVKYPGPFELGDGIRFIQVHSLLLLSYGTIVEVIRLHTSWSHYMTSPVLIHCQKLGH
jgi:hypothetical protein